MQLPEGVCTEGPVTWSPRDEKGPWFSLNAPSVRLLVGHVGGRQFKVGDVSLSVAERPWPKDLPAYACISLTALDGEPVAQSHRLLLAASARTENTNMKWNEERTSLVGRDAWGGKTTVSEAVPLTIDLPGESFLAAALDAQGRPARMVQVEGNRITLKSEDRTLWVLIER